MIKQVLLIWFLLTSTQIIPMTLVNKFGINIPKKKLTKNIGDKKVIAHNLIIILDPEEIEHNHLDTMTYTFAIALHEKASPIIVTRNIMHNFFKTKKYEQQEFYLKLHAVYKQINVDSSGWRLYFHKQGNIALFIPRSLQNNDLGSPCHTYGFDLSNLQEIVDISPENILKHIENHSSQDTNIVDHIQSMFEKFSFFYTPRWNIFLAGHGANPLTKKQLQQKVKDDIESKNSRPHWSRPDSLYCQQCHVTEMALCEETKAIDNEVIPESGYYAGLIYKDFEKLIDFFSKNIKTSFIHLYTCFAGGINQLSMNKMLLKSKANFIVSCQGINEQTTVLWDPHTLNEELNAFRFTTFFSFLNFYFSDQDMVKKIHHLDHKDPLTAIVRSILPIIGDTNIPSVRLPHIETFHVLGSDKTIKILTNAIVKAYEVERRAIDLTDSLVKKIILCAEYIHIPLKIKKNVALVSPISNASNLNDILNQIHTFEKISWDDKLSSIISNLACFNISHIPITFVINHLECFDYEKSGLESGESNRITLNNMRVKIHSYQSFLQNDIKRLDDAMNISVTFSHNNKLYSSNSNLSIKKNIASDNLNTFVNYFETNKFLSS